LLEFTANSFGNYSMSAAAAGIRCQRLQQAFAASGCGKYSWPRLPCRWHSTSAHHQKVEHMGKIPKGPVRQEWGMGKSGARLWTPRHWPRLATAAIGLPSSQLLSDQQPTASGLEAVASAEGATTCFHKRGTPAKAALCATANQSVWQNIVWLQPRSNRQRGGKGWKGLEVCALERAHRRARIWVRHLGLLAPSSTASVI